MTVTTTMIAITLSMTVISAPALKAAPEFRVRVSEKTGGRTSIDVPGSRTSTAIAFVA
jgi:hypothetical protein